jgi:hypothetical protein
VVTREELARDAKRTMTINDICEAIEADLPRMCGHFRGCGCDDDRYRLAIVLATLRAVGVHYHEGYTTNAPVDDDDQGGVSSSSRTFAITDADIRAIVNASLADA